MEEIKEEHKCTNEDCECEDKRHDHNCDCGHDHSHEHNAITLILDDGSELHCPIIDLFKFEEKDYVALLHPTEENAMIYNFEETKDGGVNITSIEDDEEYDKVGKVFLERFEAEEK